MDRAVKADRGGPFDADHEVFRDSVARFLAAEAVPFYADWEATRAIPSAFWAAAAQYGFVGLSGADDVRFAAVAVEEAMTAGCPAVALALAVHDSFALPLLEGRDAPNMAAVIDPAETTVQAEPRGNGWVLSGAAENVLNGMTAELVLVGARTDEGSAVLFAVGATAAGLHRSPADALLGLDACDIADLRLDGVTVTAADRIDTDPAAARARYQLALAIAAMAGARTALAGTVEYVRQRKAFGRPIAEFENTRHTLAHLGARLAAVGAFVDGCLVGAAQLRPQTAAAAKLCATELLGEAVDTGVQLHGGYGYMWEYPIARAYAAARFFRLHGGTGENLDAVLADAIGL